MATSTQLRNYLSHWFQLGKSVQIQTTGETLRPEPVMVHGSYSTAFENCWRRLQDQDLSNCYVEGTSESLAQLLSDAWDLEGCARCGMPVPQKVSGITDVGCPCADLPTWPNTELPQPRGEQNWRSQLQGINQRIAHSGERYGQPTD